MDRAQNLPGLAADNVLRVPQISSKLVHFWRSYSQQREHRYTRRSYIFSSSNDSTEAWHAFSAIAEFLIQSTEHYYMLPHKLLQKLIQMLYKLSGFWSNTNSPNKRKYLTSFSIMSFYSDSIQYKVTCTSSLSFSNVTSEFPFFDLSISSPADHIPHHKWPITATQYCQIINNS